MIKCKLSNKKFNIHGTGNQQRDFLYVEDLISKILKIIKLKSPKNSYYLSSGKKLSINNVLNMINKNSKIKLETRNISPPIGYDVSYFRKMKFIYSKSFYLKLDKTIKWYKN